MQVTTVKQHETPCSGCYHIFYVTNGIVTGLVLLKLSCVVPSICIVAVEYGFTIELWMPLRVGKVYQGIVVVTIQPYAVTMYGLGPGAELVFLSITLHTPANAFTSRSAIWACDRLHRADSSHVVHALGHTIDLVSIAQSLIDSEPQS